jgi:hypothetical protein
MTVQLAGCNSLAKLGLKSIKLAKGPVVTAPLTTVATVENTMAAVELQPEKASPRMNTPWPMQPAIVHLMRDEIIMFTTIHFRESKFCAYFEIHTVNIGVLIGEPKSSSPIILKITITYDTKPVPSTFPPHFQSPTDPS